MIAISPLTRYTALVNPLRQLASSVNSRHSLSLSCRLWCEKDADMGMKKRKDALAMKRFHWENKHIFGDLKESPRKHKRKLRLSTDKSASEVPARAQVIIVHERGFKDLEPENVNVKSSTSKSKTEGSGIIRQLLPVKGKKGVKRVVFIKPDVSVESHAAQKEREKLENETYDKFIHQVTSGKQDTPEENNESTPHLSIITKFPLFLDQSRKGARRTWLDDKELVSVAKLKEYLKGTGSADYYPGVTTVLQNTLSEESLAALDKWNKEMIGKLGEEGFAKYKEEMFKTGSKIHSVVSDFLSSGTPPEESTTDPRVWAYWKSLDDVLPHVTDPLLLETRVRHPDLHYDGVIDCVAQYRGEPVLIEWKTAQKQKTMLRYTYDAPLQSAAYLGALHVDRTLQVKKALVVVCYSTGERAHVYHISPSMLEMYWSEWTTRLYHFWCQKLREKGADIR